MKIYFDIETGAESSAIVYMPKFDESEVKTGDIDRRKLDEAEKVLMRDKKIKQAYAIHKDNFMKSCALSPKTGYVSAIGYLRVPEEKDKIKESEFIIDDITTMKESEILENFWQRFKNAHDTNTPMIGFNIKDFDLPFITKRSWKVGVPPYKIYGGWKDIELNAIFTDVYDMWLMGAWRKDDKASISLNDLSMFLGVGTKDKTMGAKFTDTLLTDYDTAINYLKNDLILTHMCHAKLDNTRTVYSKTNFNIDELLQKEEKSRPPDSRTALQTDAGQGEPPEGNTERG